MITILRLICSVVLVVLFLSVTAPAIQSGEIRNHLNLARYVVQRTERSTPEVKTAVSPDGHILAIARNTGGLEKRNARVELWDSTSGALQRLITGFDGPIWAISFSKDGRSLITVSTEFRKQRIRPSDRKNQDPKTAVLKWWDVRSGEFLRKMSHGSEGITSIEATWSPSGDVLALIERYSAGQWVVDVAQPRVESSWLNSVELKLRLFDAQSLKTRTRIEGGQQTVRGEPVFLARLAHPVFSTNGELLAAVSGGDVKLWKVDTGKRFRTLKEFNGPPTAIAFSPDGQLVAVAAVKGNMAGVNSEITVLEVSTGRLVRTLKGLNDAVACLQFAPQNRTLLIGTLQYERERTIGTVKIWDVVDNHLFRFNVSEGKTVSSMTIIPNKQTIVLQSGSDVEVRDLKTWKVIHSFDPSAGGESESVRLSPFVLSANRAVAVAFGSDGVTVSAVLPSEIRLWDSRTGGVKNRLSRERVPVDVIASSSNGELIAAATQKQVRLIDIRSGADSVLALQTGGPISAIALSADGRSLVTADEQGVIQIWEVSTGRLTQSFETEQEITALAVDASGQVLAAATADGPIGLWSVPAGALKMELKKYRAVVRALAFSPDGRTLASAGDDRNLILWELGSGKATQTFENRELAVTSIAFSPNGQLLASGTGNESVSLWNLRTGKLERVLR